MPLAAAPGLQLFTAGGVQVRAGLQEARTYTLQ